MLTTNLYAEVYARNPPKTPFDTLTIVQRYSNTLKSEKEKEALNEKEKKKQKKEMEKKGKEHKKKINDAAIVLTFDFFEVIIIFKNY